MSAIDIIIVIVFVGAVIVGFHRGIIRQMGSLCAMVVGVIACRVLGGVATTLMLKIMGASEPPAEVVEYSAGVMGNVVIFLLAYVGIKIAVKGARALTKILLMGPIDSILGALFTVVEWMLGLSIVLNLWASFSPESTWLQASKLGNGLSLQALMDFAPRLWGTLTAPGLFGS